MAGRQGVAGGGGAPPIGSPLRVGIPDLGSPLRVGIPDLGSPLRVGIRDLAHARAVRAWAAAGRRPVVLHGLDAPAVGVAFWRAVEVRLGTSLVVDCGDEAGTVLAALRVGLRRLAYGVEGPQAAALEGLLRAHDAVREPTGVDVVLSASALPSAQLARWCFEHGDRGGSGW
jgi:hypothetical protein